MKKQFAIIILLLLAGMATQAQGYLGIGSGVSSGASRNAWVVNLQGGYQAKHFVLELEMKTPTANQDGDQPAIFSAKAGYPLNFAEDWSLVPYMQYSYQYYSADVSKTATWQNGFQPGAGLRLQYKLVFAQVDHFKNNYFSVGISKTLPHR